MERLFVANPSVIPQQKDNGRIERSYSLALEGALFLLKHFVYAGSSHSAADTHGYDAPFGVSPFCFM
jgi:hypothetical protein